MTDNGGIVLPSGAASDQLAQMQAMIDTLSSNAEILQQSVTVAWMFLNACLIFLMQVRDKYFCFNTHLRVSLLPWHVIEALNTMKMYALSLLSSCRAAIGTRRHCFLFVIASPSAHRAFPLAQRAQQLRRHEKQTRCCKIYCDV